MSFKAVKASFKQQLIQFTADPQWIIPSIVAPFLFTAVMLMMYPEKSDTIVLQAILGGGVLGMWGNTLFASSFTLSYDRMNGTLDNILMSPSDLYYVIAGRSLWNTFIGLLNMLLVYVFAELMFSAPVVIAEPLAFILILIVTLLSLASIGMLFSLAFVLSGAVVPITMLPAWTQPISMVLAPAWGVEALRASAIPGYEVVFGFDMVGNSVICIALMIAYTALSWYLMKVIVKNVLETGSFTRY